MSQQVENLMNLAEEAGFPRQIMAYLIDNQIIANLNDLHQITPDEVQGLTLNTTKPLDISHKPTQIPH